MFSSLILALLSPAAIAAEPAMSLTFAFEPRFGSYAALDDALLAYDFTPVEGPALPAWGLRGRAFFEGGSFLQLAMTYGIRVSDAGAIPTVTTLTETTGGAGYRHRSGAMASLDAGFSVLSQAVASNLEGGALVYMGPVVHPRIGWFTQLGAPFGSALAVVLGGSIQRPVGAAHSIPLWEEDFERRTVTALTLGVESGVGLQGAE